MTEISYNDIKTFSDAEIIQRIGGFTKHHRILLNKSQEQMAREIGIARSTLSLFERGENTSLLVFVQILRALNLLDSLGPFQLGEQEVSLHPLSQANQRPFAPKQKTNRRTTTLQRIGPFISQFASKDWLWMQREKWNEMSHPPGAVIDMTKMIWVKASGNLAV